MTRRAVLRMGGPQPDGAEVRFGASAQELHRWEQAAAARGTDADSLRKLATFVER